MTVGRTLLWLCTAGYYGGSKQASEPETHNSNTLLEEPGAVNAQLLREASQGVHLAEAEAIGEVLEAKPILDPDSFLRPDEKETRANFSNLDVLQYLAEKIMIRQEGIKSAEDAGLASVSLLDLGRYLPEGNFKQSIVELSSTTTLNELILHTEKQSQLSMLLKAAAFAEISKYKEIRSGYDTANLRIPEESYFSDPHEKKSTKLKDTSFEKLVDSLQTFRGEFKKLARATGKQ